MADTIHQMRLSMRLDAYLRTYESKHTSNDSPSEREWNVVWEVANTARVSQELTSELVDDVRIALNNL
ncbi:hypothetical protein [Tengunoibacter tsumagoiensis]|uniref:Uncharacterized protein n=1 Tax=Tengunoibacter tsumagoiensis TaxID=2014871 RepID=A0A402A9S3_9CHLR|nr:hypothetical protein [Tengunoibacter tsumagoiensis]GCE15903.1 hypothetical protein KTT_57620 [Tengunoibacter tsumagoiensis]